MDFFILFFLGMVGMPLIIVESIESIKNFRNNKELKKRWLTQKYSVKNRKCPNCGFPLAPFGRMIQEGIPPIIDKKFRLENLHCIKCNFNEEIVVYHDETGDK